MAKTILIVDDDANDLQQSRAILSPKYSVWTFKSGYKALTALQGGITPQLILCCFRLADMDGGEFKTRVREQARLREVPFIYLIAFSERRLSASEDYLFKPFGTLELRELVDRRLAPPSQF